MPEVMALAPIALLAVLLGAVSSDRTGDTLPTVIVVEAHDYAYTMPAKIPAGIVTFRLVNHGKESHHAQVVRLEDGKTAGDVMRAFTDTAPMPSWVRYLGGPAGTAPGHDLASTTRLTPGRYVLICRVASPDRIPHVKKGMIREFEVVEARDAAQEAFPIATDTVTLNDYGFAVGRPFTAGHHTVRVENAGPQPHEMILLKLNPGKTPVDFARWGLAGRHGPAPGAPVGGVQNLDRGATGLFEVDFAAGDYGFICFVPDATDGKRHFVHGMSTRFSVY